MEEDTNELISRLSTVAGIIMEDACPIAIAVRRVGEVEEALSVLERATGDANLLIQAAQILAVRNIR